jgi:hypothetical protein
MTREHFQAMTNDVIGPNSLASQIYKLNFIKHPFLLSLVELGLKIYNPITLNHINYSIIFLLPFIINPSSSSA